MEIKEYIEKIECLLDNLEVSYEQSENIANKLTEIYLKIDKNIDYNMLILKSIFSKLKMNYSTAVQLKSLLLKIFIEYNKHRIPESQFEKLLAVEEYLKVVRKL